MSARNSDILTPPVDLARWFSKIWGKLANKYRLEEIQLKNKPRAELSYALEVVAEDFLTSLPTKSTADAELGVMIFANVVTRRSSVWHFYRFRNVVVGISGSAKLLSPWMITSWFPAGSSFYSIYNN